MIHVPVMVREVLQHLLHDKSILVCDATVGCGGHAQAILETRRDVTLMGIDRDPEALEESQRTLQRYGDRVQLIQGNFAEIGRLLSLRKVDGILVDLGISSLQLDKPARGFSHGQEGPLDMQMSPGGRSAAQLIAASSAAELADVLRHYGEVTRPMGIARAIRRAADEGTMTTTADLKKAVGTALRGNPSPSLLSKIFQAIRIAVNSELENIDRFLTDVAGCMNAGATLVMISYHSLEDRRVKDFLRRESRDCLCPPSSPVCTCGHVASFEVLTRRVIKPQADEIRQNPRARSARLRAARFLGGQAA